MFDSASQVAQNMFDVLEVLIRDTEMVMSGLVPLVELLVCDFRPYG